MEDRTMENGRAVAMGGLRRVYKLRQKARALFQPRRNERTIEDDGEDDRTVRPIIQNTSNHYTLNMPSAPAPQSDTPYVLLG